MDPIESLVDAWTHAWNAHDMTAAAALVDTDVDFVTVAGLWLRGRAEFFQHHSAIHRAHLRDTTWTTHAWAARLLAPDLRLLHLEWTITGERAAGDVVQPPRSGIFTWIVAGPPGAWRIAVAHNTNLRAGITHRLVNTRSRG